MKKYQVEMRIVDPATKQTVVATANHEIAEDVLQAPIGRYLLEKVAGVLFAQAQLLTPLRKPDPADEVTPKILEEFTAQTLPLLLQKKATLHVTKRSDGQTVIVSLVLNKDTL